MATVAERIEGLLREWSDPRSPEFDPAHDYWHIVRVRDLALKLGKDIENQDWARRHRKRLLKKLGADAESRGSHPTVSLQNVEWTALLHEIADPKAPAELDRRTRVMDLFPDPETRAALSLVFEQCEKIGFRGGFEEPEGLSLEAQIVADADALDALGAIGIARTFMYAGKKGRKLYDPEVGIVEIANREEYYEKEENRHAINHFYEKLLKLEERMFTEAGRRVARKRTQEMRRFLGLFYAEWQAEDV